MMAWFIIGRMRLLNLLSLILGILLLVLSSALFIARRQPAPAWIGFSDYFNQLYLYDLNNEELHVMGSGAYPIWLPKGHWMMYGTTTYSNFPSELHISKYPYRSSRLITSPDFRYSQEYPHISPNGEWIAFSAWAGMEAYGMFYMSADGHEIYHLANWSDEATPWSPDGKKLAFLYEGGLYVVTAGQGSPVDVTNLPPFGAIPLPDDAREIVNIPDTRIGSLQWSSDGKWLFFRAGNGEIFRVRNDGSHLEQLTDGSSNHRVVSFGLSPDSQQIVFVTYEDLYVMRSDGSELKHLLGEELIATPIGWSPDGKWIYFRNSSSEDSFTKGIYRIRSDGSYLEQIIADSILYDAVLSPDGEWIAYYSGDDLAVYRIRNDGSRKELLANTHPEVTFISWSPPINKSWDYLILVGISAIFAGAGLSSQKLINKRGI
ncbi:MAG: hypothetical protein DPW16_05785 [Chloroflexi bacterium]|nr:hypothetical protein [Chloroflexota bacterium]